MATAAFSVEECLRFPDDPSAKSDFRPNANGILFPQTDIRNISTAGTHAIRSSRDVGRLLQEWQAQAPAYETRPKLKDLMQFSTEETSTPYFQAGACTTYGQRPCQEDAYIFSPSLTTVSSGSASSPLAIFAVCDGHGGSFVSEEVSRMFSAVLRACIEQCNWDDEAERRLAIEQSFFEMDRLLRAEHASTARRCGTTCTAAVIWQLRDQHHIILANLGDSRGLLYRVEDDLLLETCDHKPDNPIEKKRIREAGGFVLPADHPQPARLDGLLAFSRAFGDFEFKVNGGQSPAADKLSSCPDIYELEARDGDFIVLATDGLFDVLSSNEVAALALQQFAKADECSPRETAATLVWAALQNDAADNVTCLLIRLGNSS